MNTFEDNPRFLTFETFPKLSVISKTKFSKEKFSDLKGKDLEIVFDNELLYNKCIRRNNEFVGFGHFFNIIYNLLHFVNANRNFVCNDYASRISVQMTTIKDYQYTSFDLYSYELEKINYIIIVPKSSTLNSSFDLTKVSSSVFWTFLIGFLICCPKLLSKTFLISKNKMYFDQSFSKKFFVFQINLIFYIFIFLGFIIPSWNMALKRGFPTSKVQSSKIRTLEDIRKANIKLKVRIKYFQLISFPRYDEFVDLISGYGQTFGYIVEDLDFFLIKLNYFDIPADFIQSDYIIETSFLRIKMDFSNYESIINRYIIMDTGLYNYWKQNLDVRGAGLLPKKQVQHVDQKATGFLDITYYYYLFLRFIIGLALSIIIFGIEHLIYFCILVWEYKNSITLSV